jgi:hypothetical protein
MTAEGDDRFELNCGTAQRYNRVGSVRERMGMDKHLAACALSMAL